MSQGLVWRLRRVPRLVLRMRNTYHQLMEAGVPSTTRLPLATRVMMAVILFVKMVARSDITSRASATAYSFVFAIVPLLASTLAFFTVFPGLNDKRQELRNFLYSTLLPGAAREVTVYLEKFADAATAAGAVSSLVFLVTVLSLFSSLESTYNRIWGVTTSRTWLQRVQILAVFFLTGAIGTALMVVISQKAQLLTDQVSRLGNHSLVTLAAQVGYFVADVLVSWGVFYVANQVIPSTRVKASAALTGAIVVGSFWQFFKGAFTWYIENYASYESIYGAVGTVPIFLLWVYLTIVMLLASSYLAFVHQNLRSIINNHHAGQRQSTTASYHAMLVTAALADAFVQRKAPLSLLELEERSSTNEYILRGVLDKLETANLVIRVTSDPPRWMLAAPGELMDLSEIVVAVEGQRLQVPQQTAREIAEPNQNARIAKRAEEVLDRTRAQLQLALGRTHVRDLLDPPTPEGAALEAAAEADAAQTTRVSGAAEAAKAADVQEAVEVAASEARHSDDTPPSPPAPELDEPDDHHPVSTLNDLSRPYRFAHR